MGDSLYSDPNLIGDRNAPRRPNPANAVAIRQFRRTMAADFPGQWTADRWSQSQHFNGVVYRAIMTRMTAMASSTVQVLQYNPKPATTLKAQSGTHHANDELWTPVEVQMDPDDDADGEGLAKLLERPNDTETTSQILAQLELQYNLTGSCNLWMSRSKGGWVSQLYSLPTALLLYQPPTQEYPLGYWRVQQNYPGYAALTAMTGYSPNLDVRDVLTLRAPHPLWRWDGYSPLTAGSVQLDILESLDTARWSVMNSAIKVGAVIKMPGANLDQIQGVQAQLSGSNEGSHNWGKSIGMGGELDSQGNPTWDISFPTPNASQLDFAEGYDQMAKVCLAIFGVPGAVANWTEADSYASFFAKLKQFHTLTLQPQAKQIGDWLTRGLAAKFGRGLRIQIDVPKIDDQESQRALLAMNPGPLYTLNEARGTINLPPVEGGDVPTEVYVAKLQGELQAEQEQQQQAMQAAMGGMPGDEQGAPQDGMPGDAQDQPPADITDDVTSAALEALGVDSAGNDGASATPGPFDAVTKGLRNDSRPGAGIIPPRPGLTFDKGKHRWVRSGKQVSSGQSGAERIQANPQEQQANHGLALPENSSRLGNLARSAGQSPEEFEASTPNWASMSNKEIVTALRSRTAKPAARIAERVAANPQERDVLSRAHEWADAKATKHAALVAQKLGITPERAKVILAHAIRTISEAALKQGGSASGTLKVGDRSIKIGVGHKPTNGKPASKPAGDGKQTSPAQPPRPTNTAGKGSLPPRKGIASRVGSYLGGLAKRVEGDERTPYAKSLPTDPVAAVVADVCEELLAEIAG